ncbi:hypothetical protein AX774_g7752 [Zancudomyces culisetae]|uniref:Uncharacterized protein n=1 Tax=Zancudomyces culisetae TaxID=1213189 RepID=A0A1R1PD45_ZANCU|nr:hypothetical protein AX774_g7752 [Zancudomyces culisetae]|eukprot:OMH78851.1 hypothetical protein AX774_g7752 [Zancudomyces culisetae]
MNGLRIATNLLKRNQLLRTSLHRNSWALNGGGIRTIGYVSDADSTVIPNTVDVRSKEFKENRQKMEALVGELNKNIENISKGKLYLPKELVQSRYTSVRYKIAFRLQL